MPDFPNFEDLFRIGRDEALLRDGRLSLEIIEREGTDANILNASASAMAEEVVSDLADVFAANFLDSARGEDLDKLVFDRYGLERTPAANALTTVNFSTTTPNPGAFPLPLQSVVATADGVQYELTVASVFPAASTGPIAVSVRALIAGLDQQVKANTLTSIITQLTGSPTDLVVTNPLASAGAADEEPDVDLRRRGKRFFTTARRGTLDAIEAAAVDQASVRTASAFEALDAFGRPAQFAELVITDEFTESLAELDTVPTAYATQSQALAATVFAGLSNVRPAGTFIRVTVAQVILQPVVLVLAFVAGADISAADIAARATLVNYINELSPGETFVVEVATNRLRSVNGLSVTGDEIFSPGGNVVPNPLEVLRTTLALVRSVPLAQFVS